MRLLMLLWFATLTFACATPGFEQSGSLETSEVQQSKTIVFVHGMYVTNKSWDAWESYFKDKGYTVYAPAWPLHDLPVAEQKALGHEGELVKLNLNAVLDHYRKFIDTLPEKPILVGHSMGGLITQILISEGRGVSGVAIDSAPPKGLISLNWGFIRSNWPVISPFASEDEPINMSAEQYHYAMTSCLPEDVAQKEFETKAVPESRRVGKIAFDDVSEVPFDKKTKPLLIIGGSTDRIIPASLNYKNFQAYEDSKSLTEFKVFDGRCHWILEQDGWQEVAEFVDNWIHKSLVKGPSPSANAAR